MRVRAHEVRPGHHIASAEVAWVLSPPDLDIVLVAADLRVQGGGRGARQILAYHRDQLVDVDDAPSRG